MKYFLTSYAILLLVLIPSIYLVHQYPIHRSTIDLSIGSCVLLTVISAIAYGFLFITRKNPKGQLFIGLTMGNTLIKMVVSILLLILYKLKHPELKGYFIVPFLIIYLLFTIFETKVMLHLANQKPS
jgi:hypothetical protein